MRRIANRLPGPAMVVAVIALIAALAGTATAAGVLSPKQFKKKGVRGPVTYVTATQSVNTALQFFNGATNVPGVNITAACPNGNFPTGGGVKSDQPSLQSGLGIQFSYPSPPRGWTFNVFGGFTPPGAPATTPPSAENISVIAVCVKSKRSSGTLPAITL